MQTNSRCLVTLFSCVRLYVRIYKNVILIFVLIQALIERDEQVRKAREEALQSSRDLEAQLAAESSANQDLQVNSFKTCRLLIRNVKCCSSLLVESTEYSVSKLVLIIRYCQ